MAVDLREALRLHLTSGVRPGLAGEPRWALPELSGRVVELSGRGASCGLTLAVGIVVQAQRVGEPAVWVAAVSGGAFFPPDAAAAGLDLRALPVVQAPSPLAAGRAAEHLLRSGAFGLLVFDLGEASMPVAAQARIARLAQRHESVVLCLTDKPVSAPSMGPLISLHAHAARRRVGDDRFECDLEVAKDRRRGPGRTHREVCSGPPGLR